MSKHATLSARIPLTGLWRHPGFLKLWTGQTVSSLGSQITSVALPLTAVVTLQATPVQMGLIGALSFAPSLLFGLVAGPWVDQRRKRPLLIGVEVARALLLVIVPVGALLGWLRIEHLYLLSFLIGLLALLFDITYQSFLPLIVPRADLLEGNSKLEVSYALSQLLGPGLAGWLVQLLSAPVTIACDAASFGVSALNIWLIGDHEPPAPPPAEHSSIWEGVRAGLHAVLASPLLRPLIASQMIDSLFSTMLFAVYTLFLTQELGLSAGAYGLLLTMFAPGSFIGALLARPLGARWGAGATMIAGQVLIALGFGLRALAGGHPALVFGLLLVAHLAIGCGNRLFGITQISLRQATVPQAMYGRVNATIRFLNSTMTPAGALLGGVLGQFAGLRPTIGVAALGIGLAVLLLLCSPLRTLRQPEPLADESAY